MKSNRWLNMVRVKFEEEVSIVRKIANPFLPPYHVIDSSECLYDRELHSLVRRPPILRPDNALPRNGSALCRWSIVGLFKSILSHCADQHFWLASVCMQSVLAVSRNAIPTALVNSYRWSSRAFSYVSSHQTVGSGVRCIVFFFRFPGFSYAPSTMYRTGLIILWSIGIVLKTQVTPRNNSQSSSAFFGTEAVRRASKIYQFLSLAHRVDYSSTPLYTFRK